MVLAVKQKKRVAMVDSLPHSVLLNILSRLDDSADVARCRVASKAFNTVFPGLRSINLQYTVKWYNSAKSRVSKSLKTVFLDLVPKLEAVESVRIGNEMPIYIDHRANRDYLLTDDDFIKMWLPRVSGSLKLLVIYDRFCHRFTNVLPLISTHCHNLVKLKLSDAWLSVESMNPMPMLTSLTLVFTSLKDENLNEMNKCFPNLQVLNLINILGLRDPKIHLLNLICCHLDFTHRRRNNNLSSLTLITPNLITLRLECLQLDELVVGAPMLSDFQLSSRFKSTLTLKKFENLKTLFIFSPYIGSLLSKFSITETVESLALNQGPEATRDTITLGKVFRIFPNMNFLCVHDDTSAEVKACLNPIVCEIWGAMTGFKTLRVYLPLVDPSLTFSYVARLLDQRVDLSVVSLFFNDDIAKPVYDNFMSKCLDCWPDVTWRLGTWKEDMKILR